jgi:Na+-translocating ferredoxin:NAD+ oxidoreductase subunit B
MGADFFAKNPYHEGCLNRQYLGNTSEEFMAKAAGKARKKLPKELAVIRADNCTGCEACIEVCPVDCIYKVPGEDQPSLQSFCDIDLERCIGCSLCERWCPWDAIDMVLTPTIAQHVADKGGPAEYVEKNWERLVNVAQNLAEIAVEQQQPKK